jgi:hypothetical protein
MEIPRFLEAFNHEIHENFARKARNFGFFGGNNFVFFVVRKNDNSIFREGRRSNCVSALTEVY